MTRFVRAQCRGSGRCRSDELFFVTLDLHVVLRRLDDERHHAFLRLEVLTVVLFKGFYPGKGGCVANVVIRFEGIQDLTPAILAGKGYPGMTPVAKGSRVELEFLILYELNAQGLVQHIKGAVYVPAAAAAAH